MPRSAGLGNTPMIGQNETSPRRSQSTISPTAQANPPNPQSPAKSTSATNPGKVDDKPPGPGKVDDNPVKVDRYQLRQSKPSSKPRFHPNGHRQTPAQPRGLRPFSTLCLSSPQWVAFGQSVDNSRGLYPDGWQAPDDADRRTGGAHRNGFVLYCAGCTSSRCRRLLTSIDATLSGRQGSTKSRPEAVPAATPEVGDVAEPVGAQRTSRLTLTRINASVVRAACPDADFPFVDQAYSVQQTLHAGGDIVHRVVQDFAQFGYSFRLLAVDADHVRVVL
jgi:hypothetical protein